ncbi:MAG: hypothetical protein JJV98_00685 [Desulfosarcina sp.]|nr:hypothetical protein [Desulfobacterales bacterium]
MEMYVVQEKGDNRSDSVFYRGQVAYAVMPNGRKLALQACGEVKFIIPRQAEKPTVYGNNEAAGGLEKMDIAGLTDADLPQDKRLWLHRNHFEIVKLSRYDDVVGDGIVVGRDYDEALDRFLEYCVTLSNR